MRHQTISFIKSAFRIVGYLAIGGASYVMWTEWPQEHVIAGHLLIATMLLVASEVLGIVEEIGHE